MVDPEKAAAAAKKMGGGVTVKKVEKIDEGGRKGSRTVYAFKDVNTLSYDFGKGLNDMGGGMMPDGATEEAAEPLKFSYADGVLTMKNPGTNDGEKEAPKEELPDTDPAQLAQAKQMLGGMKMSVTLEFPGGIAETNATHREGDKVTLMMMDMGKLLDQPETFAKLQQAQPESPAEMSELLEGVEGMKVEAQDELRLKLK
jgi:hypothetical protein